MTELLPCPFCGCTAIYVTHTHYYDDEDTVCMFCNGCKSIVILESNEAEGINDKTRAEAIEAWNSRAAYEMEGWFYLPKPKQRLFNYTTDFLFDDVSLKATGTVDVYALADAVRKWQEEELNQRIIERICEVFKTERTCEVEVRESAWGGYTRHCGNCGADLDCDTRNRQNYCPNCGAKVVDE